MPDKNRKDELADLERLHMAEHLGEWYGWGSPIGLSVFFLSFSIFIFVIGDLIIRFFK